MQPKDPPWCSQRIQRGAVTQDGICKCVIRVPSPPPLLSPLPHPPSPSRETTSSSSEVRAPVDDLPQHVLAKGETGLIQSSVLQKSRATRYTSNLGSNDLGLYSTMATRPVRSSGEAETSGVRTGWEGAGMTPTQVGRLSLEQ